MKHGKGENRNIKVIENKFLESDDCLYGINSFSGATSLKTSDKSLKKPEQAGNGPSRRHI